MRRRPGYYSSPRQKPWLRKPRILFCKPASTIPLAGRAKSAFSKWGITMRPNLKRRQQIIHFRKKGMTRREIAAHLGISKDLVGGYLHQLILDGTVLPLSKQEGNKRKTVKHKVDIVKARQMRLGGKSYREIGECFGVSGTTIENLIGSSVRITPMQRQLIDLRSQGLSYKEIAARIGRPAGTVAVILSRLVRKGLVPPGIPGRKDRRAGSS
jgi:transposase